MCPTHLLQPIPFKTPSTNQPPLFDSGEEFWLGEMWKRRWQRNWSSQRVSLCAIDWMNGQTRWGWRGKHSLHPLILYTFSVCSQGAQGICARRPSRPIIIWCQSQGLVLIERQTPGGNQKLKWPFLLPVKGYSGLLNPSPSPGKLGCDGGMREWWMKYFGTSGVEVFVSIASSHSFSFLKIGQKIVEALRSLIWSFEFLDWKCKC